MPADLPVNEKQTSTAFDKMMAQDTDAPLRGFPGSELRGPGATGIAASGGRATLPAAALKRFLEDNDGRVLVDNAGARHVLVLGRDRDELWLLDGSGGTGGTGAIADTGHLVRRRAARRSRCTMNAFRCGRVSGSATRCRCCPPENGMPRCG